MRARVPTGVRPKGRAQRGFTGLLAVFSLCAAALVAVGVPAANAVQATGDDVPAWNIGWNWNWDTSFRYQAEGTDVTINETATQVLGSVITALSTDPEFAEAFREKFIAPKVAVTQAIYQRAQQRGEVAADIDLEMIGPALAGILLHRTFILGIPPDDATIERVVDHVILPAVQHPSCGGLPGRTAASVAAPTTKARNTP